MFIMRSQRKLQLVSILAAAAVGCGGTKTDEYSAATPDVAGLALETSGTSEATTSAALAVAPGVQEGQTSSALATACAPYQYLCNIHASISGLNTYVHAAVDRIEALADTTPTTVTTDTKVYGPVDAPAAPATPVASFRLTVKKTGEGIFRWKLEGKPLGAADSSYVIVAAGVMHRTTDDHPHRGHGMLGIDLDNLYTLNPASGTPVWNGEGKLFVGYGHVGDAKSLLYVLKDFTPDRTQTAPVPSAVLVGHKTALGIARVRIASVDEFIAPATGTTDAGNELLLSRAAWFPGLGGRAVVAVGGGDVPSYNIDFFLGISCYNKTESEVFRALYGCKAGTCTLVGNAPAGYNVGTPDLCLLGTELDVDPTHPPQTTPQVGAQDEAPETGAPVSPDAPPTTMDDVKF
jgi:hypothetical protein